jgi:hypothetical protein
MRTGKTLLLPRSVPSLTAAELSDTTRAPVAPTPRRTMSWTRAPFAATRTMNAPFGKRLSPERKDLGANQSRALSARRRESKAIDASLPGSKA